MLRFRIFYKNVRFGDWTPKNWQGHGPFKNGRIILYAPTISRGWIIKNNIKIVKILQLINNSYRLNIFVQIK